MSHPFGDLLSQHLHRKHGLSQAKLAAGILQDPAVVAQMCHGRRLTGQQARERVVAIINWLHDQAVLDTAVEANALLIAAGMASLNVAVPAGQALQRRLQIPALNATVQSQQLARESRMPVAAGPLIGRHQELMGVVQCLTGSACRLLNLVGPGGIGKTRLAIEAAHAVGDHFAHGVFWANLQPILDPAGLASAIADALALPLTGRDMEAAQLVHYLRNKHLLLILDNFEQLVTAADLLVEIVAQAPRVTLLVTSREAIPCRRNGYTRLAASPSPPLVRGAEAPMRRRRLPPTWPCSCLSRGRASCSPRLLRKHSVGRSCASAA